jgi:hypothetical protein
MGGSSGGFCGAFPDGLRKHLVLTGFRQAIGDALYRLSFGPDGKLL